MLMIDNKLISDDVLTTYFACDLRKCHGLCCREGDAGAPLEIEELDELDNIQDIVLPYLNDLSKEIILLSGGYTDFKGEFVTRLVNNKDCVYAIVEDGIYKCAIEKAFFNKQIKFRKPISCFLYPIRVTKSNDYYMLNYDVWHICNNALCNGSEHKIILLQFLKEPLIEKFGKDFYDKLKYAYEEFNK